MILWPRKIRLTAPPRHVAEAALRVHRVRHARRAGAVLEAILVLPVLLYLAFGTVEFGYYFYVKNSLQGAAREGARAAIVPGAVETDVTNAITTSMAAANLPHASSGYTVVTIPADVSTATAGTQVTCTVSCIWGTVGAGYRPWGFIGTAKVVAAASVMRHE